MKERTPESVSDPDDDYARRYGTQSIDESRPEQDEPSASPRGADPFDGFGDYAKRHRADAGKRTVYGGFHRYAARYSRGRKATREPLTTREQVGGAIFYILAIAVFIVAFKVLRPYVLARFPGELGMGGLVVLGFVILGSMIVTAVFVAIVAMIFGRK